MSYGSGTDQFLVAYVLGSDDTDVSAKLVSGNGGCVGHEMTISAEPLAQSTPQITYAASVDRWLVTFEDRVNRDVSHADVNAVLVNGDGTVGPQLTVGATVGSSPDAWDVPCPIAYNSVTDTFFATWYNEPTGRGTEVPAPQDSR